MYVLKTTTTTSTPALALLGGGRNVDLYGVIATYAESATYFIKFWYGTSMSSATPPTIGTTVPSLTIPISASGPGFICSKPIQMQAPVYWAATLNAVDTDDTALGTGGDIVNLLLE